MDGRVLERFYARSPKRGIDDHGDEVLHISRASGKMDLL